MGFVGGLIVGIILGVLMGVSTMCMCMAGKDDNNNAYDKEESR